MTRVIGPPKSRRRHWLFLLSIAVTAGLCVLYVSGALATGTQAEGVFQLDGNALKVLGSTPAMPPATEDADNICAGQRAVQGGGGTSDGSNAAGQVCNIPSSYPNPPFPAGYALPAATSSTRFAFVTDGSGNFPSGSSEDIYTGGSKDGSDVSTWVYKDAASSNDKSDIENAFAAFYTAPTTNDKVVYFGGDRTSNSGDENTAFWFLQSPAMESPCSNITGSGCPFTTDGLALASDGSNAAHHVAANPGPDNCLVPQGQSGVANAGISFVTGLACTGSSTGDSYGDILVVSAFTGGGTQPNITAYEWIGNGFAKGASTQFCGTSSCTTIQILQSTPGCTANEDTAACAITDQGITNPPGTTPGNALPTPSPWVYTEKSSDSCTSSSCGASKCTVTANAMCPGIYFEAGLNLTKLGLQSECTSTFLMDTRSSQSVDASLQDLAIGQVGSCTTSLTTKAGDIADTPENNPSVTAAASPTSIGTGSVSSGTDTAAISVSGANSYTGTLTWFICGPLASVPTTGPACDRTKGVPAGSASVSESDGNTHFFASGTATLTSAGTYCWTAHFEPTAGQNAQIKAKDDTGGSAECFTVAPVTPTLTTCSGTFGAPPSTTNCTPASAVPLGSSVSDRALLSGLATEPGNDGASHGGNSNYPSINAQNGAYAGSISFQLNGPSDAGTGCGTSPATGTGTNPQSTPSTGAGSVASTGNGVYGPFSFTPDHTGTFHWQATISNASAVNNSLPVSDNANCDKTREDVTVLQHPTTTVTAPQNAAGASVTTVVLNGASTPGVFDNAVVTDTDSGGPAPTGSVDFTICNPSQVTGASGSEVCPTSAGTLVQTVQLTPGSGSTSTATTTLAVTPDTVGVWCFRAKYNPADSSFKTSSDNTHDECFTVVNVSMTTTQSFTITDTAHLTASGPGATVGGTGSKVEFQLFTNATCSGTPLSDQTNTTVPSGTSADVALPNPVTIDATTSGLPTLSWLVIYTPGSGATNKTVTETCNVQHSSLTITNG